MTTEHSTDRDDLVAFLRHEGQSWRDNFGGDGFPIFDQAADEIERLSAEDPRCRCGHRSRRHGPCLVDGCTCEGVSLNG